MKKVIVFCSIFLAAAALRAQNINVVSYTPKGQTYGYKNVAVSATFDAPMVALGEASQQDIKDCPIKLTPAAEGACRWTGTQTITFEAKQLSPSTKYNVTLSKLKSEVNGRALGGGFSWSFNTERLRVTRFTPYDGERWVGLEPTMLFAFNAPVDLKDLQKSWGPDANIIALDKRAREKNRFYGYEDDTVFSARPKTPLKSAQRYTVTINNLKPIGGNIAMPNYTSYFNTYGPLDAWSSAEPACLPYTSYINFSNPVTAKEIMANIKVSPAAKIRPLEKEEEENVGSDYGDYFAYPLRNITFEPSTTYTVTLGKNTKDMFGNTLGRDVQLEFANYGYCPAMEISTGVGVLESYLKPYHPVSVVNLPEVQASFTKLDSDTFIEAYNSYTGCYRAPFKNEYSFYFDDTKDKTLNAYINLEEMLGDDVKGLSVFSLLPPARRGDACWLRPAFDNVTDVGLTLKSSPEGVLVWAAALKDAAPMAGLDIEFRDRENNIIWNGKTDKDGFALSPSWNDMGLKGTRPEIYAFAKSKGGLAALSTGWTGGIEPWRFNISYNWDPRAQNQKTALILNRDILKPGEKLEIKGITRVFEDGMWRVNSEISGELVITDPRGKEYVRENVDLSSGFGTFNYTLQTKPTDPTGWWSIQVLDTYHSFRLEAAKAAEFKVNINTDKPAYASEQAINYDVDGWYMFGGAMAGAAVKSTLTYGNAYLYFKEYDGYSFDMPWGAAPSSIPAVTEEGILDAQGRYSFGVNLPSVTRPVNAYIEAAVTSPDRQQLFARKSVLVTPGDFYLGLKTKDYMAEAGEEVEMDLIALNLDKEKIAKNNVTVQVVRRQYYSARKTGVNGRLEWVSEENIEDVLEKTLNIGVNGAKFKFTPKDAGEYRIIISTQNATGALTAAGVSLSVYGKGQAYWRQNNDDILMLEADQKSYKPGATAKILVKSPYEKATALVTVEREGVLDKWAVPVNGTAQTISVPVKENYLPNVYVSVILVKGRSAEAKYNDEGHDLGKPQAKFGYVNLSVEPAVKRITPKITLDKKSYKPGEIVNLEINAGKKSELAVFVVDEGVLALTGFQTKDIFKEFYSERGLSVTTADNRLFVIGQRNFGEKGENPGGGGSDDDKLGGVDLRSVFEAAPYAAPALLTNAKGVAKASFTLPDNLTKFRVMAFALTKTEFGSAEESFEVNKPVMLRPALPRFARLGDSFKCGAVLYNYGAQRAEFDTEATVLGGAPVKQKVTVQKGENKELLFDCKITDSKKAAFTFKAKSGEESDGLAVEIPVLAVESERTLATSGVVEDAVKEKIAMPKADPLANNRIEAAFASTAMLDLKGGITYLLKYPYGCLEQKMSKILPIISAETMIDDFNLGDISSYKKMTQEVLDNVSAYQTPRGGYAYWTGAYMPDPYVTAYALEVMALAKEKGYKVDGPSADKAAKWLLTYITTTQKWAYPYSAAEDATAKAYAVYALTLYGQNSGAAAQFSNVYEKKDTLSYINRIYLLMAAKNLGVEAAVEALSQDVMNAAKTANTTMHFEAPSGMSWLHMSNVKATAMALEAMLKAKGGFAGDEKAVKWLLTSVTKEGHWGSTNVNAAVFRALDAFYTTKESVEPDFKAELKLNAAQAWAGAFKGRSLEEQRAVLPFKNAEIDITKTGTGRLYYTLSQIYAPSGEVKPVNAGFEIKKEIKDASLTAGQRTEVILTITTNQDRMFVVAEDFLPAGFEIVDTSLATEVQGEADDYEYSYWGGFERNEKYDDRIAVFADYLNKGTHVYKYKVQATTPGVFALPSARVSQMYEPEVYGQSAGAQITIKE